MNKFSNDAAGAFMESANCRVLGHDNVLKESDTKSPTITVPKNYLKDGIYYTTRKG